MQNNSQIKLVFLRFFVFLQTFWIKYEKDEEILIAICHLSRVRGLY